MPVTSVVKDPAALTMTVVAEFPVPRQRLWDAYVDPRQLERFWGPPTYPATFTRHDVHVGGLSTYYMTGPDGDQPQGFWEWVSVEPLRGFEVVDGFGHPEGGGDGLPVMRIVFSFEDTPTGSRVTTTTHFASSGDLEQVLSMGMEEGMREAMGQMDQVLADLATFSAELPVETQILSETQVRISRVIRGPIELVWRAHNEPALLQQWLLGPDGWTMPVCDVATEVGDAYRYEWESDDGANRFGFTGTLLASQAPYRAVTSEQMIGTDGPIASNELTLTPVAGGTLLSLLVTYPSAEVRDTALGTGMTDGMETSYARLERSVLAAV